MVAVMLPLLHYCATHTQSRNIRTSSPGAVSHASSGSPLQSPVSVSPSSPCCFTRGTILLLKNPPQASPIATPPSKTIVPDVAATGVILSAFITSERIAPVITTPAPLAPPRTMSLLSAAFESAWNSGFLFGLFPLTTCFLLCTMSAGASPSFI